MRTSYWSSHATPSTTTLRHYARWSTRPGYPRSSSRTTGCSSTDASCATGRSGSRKVPSSSRPESESGPTTSCWPPAPDTRSPPRVDSFDTHEAQVRYRAAHDDLDQAERVLLLGAGPVGIELAGEITSAWPDKSVVLVDSAPDVLAGPFSAAVRAELRRQLAERGIELVLGSALRKEPPTQPGQLGPFTVTTETGSQLSADLWFRCFGVSPVSDYLAEELSGARRADGHLDVTPTLQLVGHETVFAIGDVSAADRNMAGIAGRQAATAAGNILALVHGESDLTAWEPSPAVIIVPIGPDGGSGQLPGSDEPATAATVSERKGRDLFVDRYAEILGATAPARDTESKQSPATRATSPR